MRNTADRSADTMRITKACEANGLTLAQTRWVINQRDDLRERLDERNDDDVAQCYERAGCQEGIEEELSNDPRTSLYTDVAGLLNGTLPEPPKPQILTRRDGKQMFYRGEVNVVFGDPEHGKTWVVLAACAEVLQNGGRALVADLDHNGAAAIVGRLLLLEAPQEALSDPDRFRLCEPARHR